MPLTGRATPEGTTTYSERHAAAAAAGHFRRHQGLWLSSVGIGTYLGEPDEETDRAYAAAVERAVELGTNVIDTAINYRLQRSERSVGAALNALVSRGALRREEVVVCTKAGFLTPDSPLPANPRQYFEEHYLRPGLLRVEDVAAGIHCMAPAYLADQMDRSLRNLDLDCVDVFYLHNPETQLTAVPPDEFLRRLRQAFEMLEGRAAEGKIQWYGTATWTAFRQAPNASGAVSLEQVVRVALEVAGDRHHFRFVQLPYNLAMPEALVTRNQALDGRSVSVLEAAAALGVTVVASASLMQAQLVSELPPIIGRVLEGLDTDAQRALQFVRSTPGLAVALVGMSDPRHVEENLRLAGVPPVPEPQLLKLFRKP